ncbi:MAG: hypothetical protein WB992_07305 [Bryobacteraceae bacterium]
MTITLDIPENIARQLAAQAQAHGLAIDAYVADILEHHTTSLPLPPHRRMSRQEFGAALDAIAQYSDRIPDMPGETFSREMIYQDHD